MTVEAIKDAIAELEQSDRHALAFWLNSLDNDAWDEQMIRDFSPGGQGIHLFDQVQQQIAGGQSVPLNLSQKPE